MDIVKLIFTIVKEFGFPVFICIWFILREERKLKEVETRRLERKKRKETESQIREISQRYFTVDNKKDKE